MKLGGTGGNLRAVRLYFVVKVQISGLGVQDCGRSGGDGKV
jgi:hypothetical protein